MSRPYENSANKHPLKPLKLIYNDNDDEAESSSTSDGGLSLVAEFDDLTRAFDSQQKDSVNVYDSYVNFVQETTNLCKEWNTAIQECRRLKVVLDERTRIISDLESKLESAKNLVDQKNKHIRFVEDERNYLTTQISKTKDLLFGKYKHQYQEAHKHFEFLTAHDNENNLLNGVGEQTSDALIGDYSISRSEDDLDISCKKWKKHRPSTDLADEPTKKKRRSSINKNVEISNSEKVCATTTITVTKDGPITATSVIESVPINNIHQQIGYTEQFQIQQRLHIFQVKKLVRTETCAVCNKKIFFGKSIAKCQECKVICHVSCKEQAQLPCIPCAHTPINNKHKFGVISDHAPTTPPMIPALLIHCVTEIEARGLDTLGLYRLSGTELEVKVLKEKLLKCRGTPSLKEYDMPTLCSVVKNFLRSLDEPLIPDKFCKDLIVAINVKDIKDITPTILQILSELPQPNRDSLAYMLIHLKRVSESEACRMPITNLAKIFAVTFMCTSENNNLQNVYADIKDRFMVLEFLLNLPDTYYSNMLQQDAKKVYHLQQTPSTDSLFPLYPNNDFGIIPRRVKVRKQKIFTTPTN